MNECSFFEALARLAEYLRVPTDQEIEHDERVRMAALAAAAAPPEDSDAAKDAKEVKQKKEKELGYLKHQQKEAQTQLQLTEVQWHLNWKKN